MADISNRDLTTSLRHMAWERAKGELRSMLHTFWAEYDSGGNKMDSGGNKMDSGFDQMKKDIEKFIEDFEGNHL